MIEFKRVKLRNFLSVGKEDVELTLNTHNITLVTGENGAAKSAVCIDSIYYALYGKAFRKVVLSNLINSTTQKGMLVELEFSSGDNEYKIVRGQKPSKFEIYINGKLKPQMANVRDYQDYLTNYVLKMDERTFRQLVIIGSSSYTPFMTLSASERRTVIEDLLRIDIFSSMQDIAKRLYSNTQTDIHELDNKLSMARMKLDIQEKSTTEKVEQLQKSMEDERARLLEYQEKKNSLSQQCESAEQDIHADTIKQVRETVNKLYDDISVISQYKAQRIEQGKRISKNIHFFSENETCPTCQQVLEKQFVAQKMNELNKKMEKFHNDISLFNKTLNEMEMRKQESDKKLAEMQQKLEKISLYKTEMRSLEHFITSCVQRIQDIDTSISEMKMKDVDDISHIKNDILMYENDMQDLKIRENVMSFITKMLKDDGVKRVVIKYYLPVLNKLIRKYLNIMNFDIEFELDENFTEVVKSKNKESYEYNNFSEGEKMRLDCAIMFAFRELAKVQSSVSTNLLILDEFDRGTLDENGFQSNVDIIRSCVNENIIVISHSPDYFSSIADRVLYARKEHGFSKLETA